MNTSTSYLSDTALQASAMDILSVADVAEYLGVGKNRVYELLKNKSIKGFRMGSTWKISRLALNTYIREVSGL